MGVSPQRFGNDLKHASTVQQNVVVPEAEDAPASRSQACVSFLIDAGRSMLAAIGLDDQSSLDAGKVYNVGRDRKLTTKAGAKLVMMAQFSP